MVPDASDFYVAGDQLPLQQGDILLAPLVRITTGDHSQNQWQRLDEEHAVLATAREALPGVLVTGGWSLMMVTTHDCGLDKEFNARLSRLEVSGVDTTDEVVAGVEDDDTLDRYFQASPLVRPEEVQVAGVQVAQDQLLAAKMVGYLPVPELTVNGIELVPASVVDLNYRCTIDRLVYVARASSVSELARTQLRYALARLDALRTPALEFELADVVGKAVKAARVAKKNPLAVDFTFDDNSKVRLLQPPGSPKAAGPARTARSAKTR